MPDPVDNPAEKRPPRLPHEAILDTLAATTTEDHFSTEALLRLAQQRAQHPVSSAAKRAAPASAQATTAHGTDTSVDDSPRISHVNLAVRLPELFPDDRTRSRYIIGEMLGEGSAGRVYTGRDANLQRPVAIKFLADPGNLNSDRTVAFIREGRTAAMLEHPGIIPVYDMDCTADGKVYLILRKITGESLHELIERQAGAEASRAPWSINARLNIMLRICEALSFAHAKGVLHRDVKPGNVMVGHHGEVILVDWGTAASCETDGPSRPRLIGTPAFMPPEQARRERADIRSDVYCAGATLFYMLTLRWPTEAEDVATFWEKKRAGIVDQPTKEERRRIPAPLLAIAMKALRADPADRYQTIDEMATDLTHYQAGQAVSAYPDTLWAFVRRWYRRNRMLFWMAAALLAVVAACGLLLYRERAREIASWGRPIEEPEFSQASDAWKEEWGFEDGRNEGQYWQTIDGEGSINLVHKKQLAGSVAIEFDAPPLPKGGMGRIYVQWFEDAEWNEASGCLKSRLPASYAFILNNQFACIRQEHSVLDYDHFSLEPGRDYHIRAEMDQYDLSLFVNGKRVCHAKLDLFHRPGHLALRRAYAGHTFANVKLYIKGPAEKVSALSVPDTFMRDGLYERAIHYYDKILRMHSDKEMAREALYKKGLCLYQQNRSEQAFAVWQGLQGTPYEKVVARWDRERLFNVGDHAAVVARIRERFPRADADERKLLATQWDRMVADLLRQAGVRDETFEAYLDVWKDLFPRERWPQNTAADLLDRLKRYDELVRSCPDAVVRCSLTLVRLNRAEEMLRRYPGNVELSCAVLLDQGRYPEVLDRYPFMTGECVSALIQAGRADEALATYGGDPAYRNEALLALGRWQEVLDAPAKLRPPQLWEQPMVAFLHGKRFEDALRNFPSRYMRLWALLLRDGPTEQTFAERNDPFVPYAKSFNVFLNGGPAPGVIAPHELWLEMPGAPYSYREIPWAQYLLVPLVRHVRGDEAALHGVLDRIVAERRQYQAGTLYYVAAYLLDQCTEAEFMAQPRKEGLEGRWLLARAARRPRTSAGRGPGTLPTVPRTAVPQEGLPVLGLSVRRVAHRAA